MPLARGSGTAVLNRWYYNTDTKTCLSYTYTGRNGNQNNFISLAECRLRCPEFQNPCSTGAAPYRSQRTDHPMRRDDAEYLPDDVLVSRWGDTGHFRVLPRSCAGPFQYTGMGGNENNFMIQQDCEKRCPGSNKANIFQSRDLTNQRSFSIRQPLRCWRPGYWPKWSVRSVHCHKP
ncbi:unnamed protein product [Sphagnum jensenii]